MHAAEQVDIFLNELFQNCCEFIVIDFKIFQLSWQIILSIASSIIAKASFHCICFWFG